MPASPPPPASVDRPIGGAVAPLSAEALEDIAAGLARIERVVPSSPDDDPRAPRSLRLIAADSYDVWLITWPAGSEIGYHDHAEATSVVRLITGSLIESVGSAHWALRPGTSVVTAPHTSHRLWNAATGEATSLHVYSPPLAAVTYHDRTPASRLHPAGGRTAPVRSRRAEATSRPEDHGATPKA